MTVSNVLFRNTCFKLIAFLTSENFEFLVDLPRQEVTDKAPLACRICSSLWHKDSKKCNEPRHRQSLAGSSICLVAAGVRATIRRRPERRHLQPAAVGELPSFSRQIRLFGNEEPSGINIVALAQQIVTHVRDQRQPCSRFRCCCIEASAVQGVINYGLKFMSRDFRSQRSQGILNFAASGRGHRVGREIRDKRLLTLQDRLIIC
jgi:hypothetical protein